jgi:O-antigen/teichoic acid export membrane protein
MNDAIDEHIANTKQYYEEQGRILDRQFRYNVLSIIASFIGGVLIGSLVAYAFELSGVLVGVLLGGGFFWVCYALLMWYGATRIDWNNG